MAKKATATAPDTKVDTSIVRVLADRKAMKFELGEVIRMNLEEIWIDRGQNIRHLSSYTEEDLNELKNQIFAAGGLLQSIGVMEMASVLPEYGNKKWMLAFGYRRVAALQLLGEEDVKWVTNIRCQVVAAGSVADFKLMQALENYGRKDITSLEFARTIQEILADVTAKYTQKDVAGMLGTSEAAISQHLKMLELPAPVQKLVEDGELTFSHVRTLMYAGIPQEKLIDWAEKGTKLTHGEFEHQVNAYFGKGTSTSTDEAKGANLPDSGSQKTAKTLSASTLKTDYVQFLTKAVDAADATKAVYTARDLELARLDAIQTVLCTGATSLSKNIEPFLQAKAQTEAATEAAKELEGKKEKWMNGLLKQMYDILNTPVDASNLNQERPNLASAIATVLQNAAVETDAARGFPMPSNMADNLQPAFAKYLQDKADHQAKLKATRDKKKADEAAKAKGAAVPASSASGTAADESDESSTSRESSTSGESEVNEDAEAESVQS